MCSEKCVCFLKNIIWLGARSECRQLYVQRHAGSNSQSATGIQFNFVNFFSTPIFTGLNLLLIRSAMFWFESVPVYHDQKHKTLTYLEKRYLFSRCPPFWIFKLQEKTSSVRTSSPENTKCLEFFMFMSHFFRPGSSDLIWSLIETSRMWKNLHLACCRLCQSMVWRWCSYSWTTPSWSCCIL